ncbi:DUF1653 domain-containing protein [Acinetobacter baumannii]|nr:DUF1653 domain-containing protein [Acinetobacter baumannii]
MTCLIAKINLNLLGTSCFKQLLITNQYTEAGMIYKHNKTGNLYCLIATANKCDNEKFPKMVVYQSLADGNIYARPYKDFFNAFSVQGASHE